MEVDQRRGNPGLVYAAVAAPAKRNQVLLDIFPGQAPKFLVVHVEICHRATQLAAPAIASQYLLAKSPVAFLLKPNWGLFGNNVTHCSCPLTSSRNVCR